MSVVICGVAVTLLTAGVASAQTATQEAKDKTKAGANKVATVATDAEITTAVKTKLLADSKVGGLKIDVDTDHGIVTLTGPVHNAAERTEAVRLARTTAGVKRVVSKLEVETAATTGRDKDGVKDKTEAAAAKTKDKTEAAAHKTKDKTEEAAHKTKDKTEEAAHKTADATKSGARKTGTVLTDAEITSAVKTKFLADKAVSGLNINVDTDHGVVTLTGPVHSATEKAEALRLARTTHGVKQVVSKLTMEPTKK